jgi:hypothetical protein
MTQARALDLMGQRGVTALVSPQHRGFVTALVPSLEFPTHLDIGTLYAGVNTQMSADGKRVVIMGLGERGRPRTVVHWELPNPPGGMARLGSTDDDVASVARELALLFGPDGIRGSNGSFERAAELLRSVLSRRHRGQADIVDGLAQVIDLPELRERIDQRICVGPAGPSIDYPARAMGPVEVANFTPRTIIARSRSVDPMDRALFAPQWSAAIDPRFAVVEVTATQAERIVKIFQRDAPAAAVVWNDRWLLTPKRPPALAELFLEGLNQVVPWRWSRAAMSDLLAAREHEDPLGAFADILNLPSLEPLFAADDWSTLTPTARRIPRSAAPVVAAFRTRAWLGRRAQWGAWKRIRVTSSDPPEWAL